MTAVPPRDSGTAADGDDWRDIEPTELERYLMITEFLTLKEVQALRDIAAEASEFNRRMELILPFYQSLSTAPLGLQRCVQLARKYIGVSMGVTVDVIDMWLKCDRNTKRTLAALGIDTTPAAAPGADEVRDDG